MDHHFAHALFIFYFVFRIVGEHVVSAGIVRAQLRLQQSGESAVSWVGVGDLSHCICVSAPPGALGEEAVRLVAEAAGRGWPLVRHPVLHFPADSVLLADRTAGPPRGAEQAVAAPGALLASCKSLEGGFEALHAKLVHHARARVS